MITENETKNNKNLVVAISILSADVEPDVVGASDIVEVSEDVLVEEVVELVEVSEERAGVDEVSDSGVIDDVSIVDVSDDEVVVDVSDAVVVDATSVVDTVYVLDM